MYIRWEVQSTSAPVFLLRRTKLAVETYNSQTQKNTKTLAGKRGKIWEDVLSRIFQTNAENKVPTCFTWITSHPHPSGSYWFP